MKKVILVLILLILAAGAGAYFGWVNVPPGSFGVAHSTLTGTVGYPLESGTFHWFWQKLLPRNFQVYLVSREPRTVEVRAGQALPGGDQLRQYGTFEIEAQASLRYALGYEAARYLIEQDMFDGFHRRLTGNIASQLQDTVSSFITENLARSARAGEEAGYDQLERLRRLLESAIGETARSYRLQETTVRVSFPQVPQLAAYNRAVSAYFDYLDALAMQEQERLEREAEKQVRIGEVDVEIEKWKRYGELLDRYPDLLKYFYIQKLSEQAQVVVIPEDQYTGFPRLLEPDYPRRRAPAAGQGPSETTPPKEAEPAEQPPREAPAQREPSESASPDTSPEEARPAPGQPVEDGRKWYETLMFWRYFQ